MFFDNSVKVLNIHNLVFKYSEISLADFSLFLSQNKINSSNSIVLVYFLILKNNINFWNISRELLDFNISKEDYLLQLQIIKSFNSFDVIFSQFFENSIIISQLAFTDIHIQQVFFDLSVLSNMNNIYFFNKKINIHSIILSSSPIDKFNLIKDKLSPKQRKIIFLSCIHNFRFSSIFILNTLFDKNSNFFIKKFIVPYLNIFSQCNSKIKTHIFQLLLNTSKNSAFKTGVQLSYSNFTHEELIDFFNQLALKNMTLFFILASGFISNPQGHKEETIYYLIKKIDYIYFSKKFKSLDTMKNKIQKI